jgi:hypothetical protein
MGFRLKAFFQFDLNYHPKLKKLIACKFKVDVHKLYNVVNN